MVSVTVHKHSLEDEYRIKPRWGQGSIVRETAWIDILCGDNCVTLFFRDVEEMKKFANDLQKTVQEYVKT